LPRPTRWLPTPLTSGRRIALSKTAQGALHFPPARQGTCSGQRFGFDGSLSRFLCQSLFAFPAITPAYHQTFIIACPKKILPLEKPCQRILGMPVCSATSSVHGKLFARNYYPRTGRL